MKSSKRRSHYRNSLRKGNIRNLQSFNAAVIYIDLRYNVSTQKQSFIILMKWTIIQVFIAITDLERNSLFEKYKYNKSSGDQFFASYNFKQMFINSMFLNKMMMC